MKTIKHINSPITPFLIVALLYFLFLSIYLETHDASFFVQAGEHFVDTTEAPDNLLIVTPFTGYDGTFYYRLALTPFTQEHTAFGITLDNSRYRHQRILYPFLGWLFSFGSPPLVIYSLIIVNYLALCAMGWFGGVYAQLVKRHALWGIIFPLYSGFLFTLSRDLTEIVASFFVLITVVALQRNRSIVATIALVLAILSKETALLVAVSLAFLWIVQRFRSQNSDFRWYTGIIPCLVYTLWQLFLRLWWNTPLTSATQANIGLPFLGMVRGFQSASSVVGGSQIRWVGEVSLLIALAMVVLLLIWRSQAQSYIKLSWGLYFVLLITLTSQVWIEDWAFLRAASLFYFFSAVILLNMRNALANSVLVIGTGVWGVLAVSILYFR